MRALLACRADPRTVPVLLLQGGIHPGESDGKDAGFIALRELLRGTAAAGVLERLAILFVPAFNVDGHERFGRWNRPNQNGPEETGWRTTAQNLNLNRDYTKADTPEMRALLALIREWDPLVCADLHVTDGADFQPDVSLQAEPINQGDAELYRRRPPAARCADRAAGSAGLAAPALLPGSGGAGRSRLGLPADGLLAALLDRVLPAAQPFHRAGRDAFLEGLRHTGARHPQYHRGARRAARRAWRRLAGRGRAGGRGRRAPRRDRGGPRLQLRLARGRERPAAPMPAGRRARP